MKKITFIGSSSFRAEFAKKDMDGRSDKGKKRDPNQKFKKQIESDKFKNTLKRNYTVAGVLGTAAGLGIGGYAVYKNKKLPQGKIVMPNIPDNPLPHLNPRKSVEGLLKKYEEEFDVAAKIHRDIKARTGKVGNNTGGWSLRKPRANLKVRVAKRSLNTENMVVKPNIKSEADAEKFLSKYQQKYKNRQPTIKVRQGARKFRFKAE